MKFKMNKRFPPAINSAIKIFICIIWKQQSFFSYYIQEWAVFFLEVIHSTLLEKQLFLPVNMWKSYTREITQIVNTLFLCLSLQELR